MAKSLLLEGVVCKTKPGKVLEIKGPIGSVEKTYAGLDIISSNLDYFFLSKCSYKSFSATVMSTVKGVTVGYFFELSFIGLGYRFLFLDGCLLLKIGYSHYIKVPIPKSVHVFGYKKRLILFGVDLGEISNLLSRLKHLKSPDVYKGKGIRLVGEKMSFKVGKQKL